jgi:hypothetical protein
MTAHVAPRGQADPRRKADWALDVGAVEANRLAGEAVDVRSLDAAVAIAAQYVRSKLVAEEDDDVGTVEQTTPPTNP